MRESSWSKILLGPDGPRAKSSKFAQHAKNSSYDIFVAERKSAQTMNENILNEQEVS